MTRVLCTADLKNAIILNEFTHINCHVSAMHAPVSLQYIFQSVLPHQCLTYIRAPRSAHAPTVRSAIHHFNRYVYM